MEKPLRSRTFRAWARRAGLALALAGGSAVAGTAAPSFGVSLRITASCDVDSGAVVEAREPAATALPEVRCAIPTPREVRVTYEPEAPAPEAAAPPGPGTVRVVTLIF